MQRKRLGWLSAALLLVLSAGVARAQFPDGPPPGGPPPDDGGGPPGMSDRGPGRQLKTLTKVLSLNSDQKVGVKAILDDQTAQMHALFAKGQSDENNTPEAWQARMTKIEQIRDDANAKIASLLNDNQKKIFADWLAKQKAEMEKRRQQMGGGDGPPPPPPDGGGPPPGI